MITHYSDSSIVTANIDHIHSIIKRFRDAFPDNFELSGLSVCPSCNGSGTPNPDTWRPGEYCDDCKGFGVKGIKRIYNEYLCKHCRGGGCIKCENKGTKDWITNIVKG